LALSGSIFYSIEIDETSTSNCFPSYYVFQNDTTYLPIQGEKGEAICLLNEDNITASWNIIKSCEPTCLIRNGGCDNNQKCIKPSGETINRCICAGYIGKYCESIDIAGIFSSFFTSFFSFFFFFFFFSFLYLFIYLFIKKVLFLKKTDSQNFFFVQKDVIH